MGKKTQPILPLQWLVYTTTSEFDSTSKKKAISSLHRLWPPVPITTSLSYFPLHASSAILLQLLPVTEPVTSTSTSNHHSIHSIQWSFISYQRRQKKEVTVSKEQLSSKYQLSTYLLIQLPSFQFKAWYLQHDQAWRNFGLIQHDFVSEQHSVNKCHSQT